MDTPLRPQHGSSASEPAPGEAGRTADLSVPKATSPRHGPPRTSTGVDETKLQYLEGVIERGLRSSIEIGKALTTIKEAQLYRHTHPTFASYCRERWGIDPGRARQLCKAAEVVANLAAGNHTNVALPLHEGQVRPLAAIEPDQQREAWSRAVKAANGATPAALDFFVCLC